MSENKADLFTEYPDVVTVRELQTMLSIGRTLAYELVHSGTVKAFRIGNRIRIPKKNVIKYVQPHLAA